MLEYQRIAGSQKFGGARTVLTGTIYGVTSGKYDLPKERVPDHTKGLIPAGTPIFTDDATRVADVHYAFKVKGGTTTKLQLEKSVEGSRVKVGMFLMVAPDSITDEGAAVAVTAVDTSNPDYDEITHAALADSATAGTILVEATAAGATASVKVKPNGFSFYDIYKHPNAEEMWIDGLYIQVDGVLLERRVPPIAPCVKAYLADPNGGNTHIRYSKSQE